MDPLGHKQKHRFWNYVFNDCAFLKGIGLLQAEQEVRMPNLFRAFGVWEGRGRDLELCSGLDLRGSGLKALNPKP